MTGIGFACNVERLLGIFRELLEEERKKCIDIFTSGNGVADGLTAIGVSDVHGLIKEDN